LFAGARGSTIAFESIDGPPQGVFRKLVTTLGEEAEARRVAVVSREGAASFRVRGYLSAQVERKTTTIAWVFDVYDDDKRRVLRVTGLEPTSHRAERRGGNAWAAADDKVLRQVARNGMDRIVAFLNSPEAPPAIPSSEPGSTGVGVAEADPAPTTAALVRTAAAAQKPSDACICGPPAPPGKTFGTGGCGVLPGGAAPCYQTLVRTAAAAQKP